MGLYTFFASSHLFCRVSSSIHNGARHNFCLSKNDGFILKIKSQVIDDLCTVQVGLLIVLKNDRFSFRFIFFLKNDRRVFGKKYCF